MAKPEREGKLLSTVSVYPPDRSKEERIQDYKIHMESGQRLEIDNRGKLEVVHKVSDFRPKQIFVISDWHLGSVASDMKAMDRIRDYVLDNPDAMVIFAGDEIEGWSGGKHSQSIDAKADLDAQQQLEFMRMLYFEPLSEAGKVLGMVTEYWAHPGWLSEKTLNTWRAMVGELDIKLIQNGGSVVLQFPNGYKNRIKVWHNPPKGSRYDEVAGQCLVMLATSESSRPDGSVAGHIHTMQTAQHLYAGVKEEPVFYVSAGTVKGINPELPGDLFATQLGYGGNNAEPQGSGVNVRPQKGRRSDMSIPFASLKHAEVSGKALSLLDRVEQQGMKEELLELIHDPEAGVEAAPVVTYPRGVNRLGSRYVEEKPQGRIPVAGGATVENPYSHMEMKAPYSVLSVDIRSKLPVAMELIANARIGATTEGYEELSGFMREVSENPHRLVLFLRNMIDRDAGKLPNRMEVLEKYVKLINGEGEYKGIKNQTLAIMMCEMMRQETWKRPVLTDELEEYIDSRGKIKTRRVYSPPVAPASYIAKKTGQPLIHHLSLLKLSIGPGEGKKTIYPVVAADKAEGHGSGYNPGWGPMRLYHLHIHEKPGAVVGTHMPNAGAATFFDGSNAYTNYPSLVSPGWWSSAVDSIGRGNVKEGAEPGQAIIFLPGSVQDEFLQFPTINREETEYMHDALMLLKGLELMGLTDKVLLKKSK